MATPVKESNGKTYGIMANYVDARGIKQRKYKGGFDTVKKALKWCNDYLYEQKSVPAFDSIKLFDLIDTMLYEKEYINKLAQSTIASYEENFEIVKNEIGNIEFSKITVTILQNVVNKFLETPRKCKYYCQCISMLYSFAIKKRLTRENLYLCLTKPTYAAKETKYYDLNTFQMLITAIKEFDDCIITPVLLMGLLGYRPSEALAIKESDLVDNILYINKATVPVRRKNKKLEQVTGETKTHKSKRGIAIDNNFIENIHAYKNNHNIQSEFLCVMLDGERITESTLEKHLNAIVHAARLPHITPYGMRHTFGQLQKSQGTDIYTISRLMGHSNIQTTAKTYFHNDNILNETAILKITNLIK